MTNQEIEQKVKEILSKKFNVAVGNISPETRLAEDLGVDSFGAVELMFEIEEAFALKIKDTDFEHVRCMNDIVGYVRHGLEQQSSKT